VLSTQICKDGKCFWLCVKKFDCEETRPTYFEKRAFGRLDIKRVKKTIDVLATVLSPSANSYTEIRAAIGYRVP
jgi:hypothetical protein